jgi:transposase
MRLHQFGLLPASIERALQPKDVEALLGKMTSVNLKLSIEFLYSQWLYLAAKVKELDKYLVVQAKSDPFAAVYLCTPGIGPLISRVLSNELGDMSQFPNERALFSFTGLTPGEHSSGDRICRGHISRQVSARLRYVLVEAAWKAIKQDKVLAEQFERLAARCGKKRAIVAVARKLIGRIRAAFKAHKLYEVGYKKAA